MYMISLTPTSSKGPFFPTAISQEGWPYQNSFPSLMVKFLSASVCLGSGKDTGKWNYFGCAYQAPWQCWGMSSSLQRRLKLQLKIKNITKITPRENCANSLTVTLILKQNFLSIYPMLSTCSSGIWGRWKHGKEIKCGRAAMQETFLDRKADFPMTVRRVHSSNW